jgi:TonB-linked SusC/RagA family outer membrane protein
MGLSSDHNGQGAWRTCGLKKIRMRKLIWFLVMMYAYLSKAQDKQPEYRWYRLEVVIAHFQSTGNYQFPYEKKLLAKSVDVYTSLDLPVTDSLILSVFLKQPYLYVVIYDGNVIMKERPKEELKKNITSFTFNLFLHVVNEKGDPVAGASVMFRSSPKGHATDSAGHLQLEWTPLDTLIITHVNYMEYQLYWKKDSIITVELIPNQQPLQEASVTGYTSNSWLSGIANTAGAKTAWGQNNVLEALRGRIAGLYISATSGIAGGSYQFRFRGQNSIGQIPGLNQRPTNDPLVIIEGIPWAPLMRPFNQLSSVMGDPTNPGIGATGFNPLFMISPADIDTIIFLKDAEATSIYGARGANGVLIIRLKKATCDKTSWTFFCTGGIGRPLKTMDVMNTEQYLDMRRAAYRNDSITPTADQAPDLLLWDSTRNRDMKKWLFNKPASFVEHDLSVTGGNMRNRYLVSFNYYKATAALDELKTIRSSILGNYSYTSINQLLKLSLTLYGSTTKNNLVKENPMYALQLAPNAPDFINSNGTLKWKEKGAYFLNPLSLFLNTYDILTTNYLTQSLIQYRLFPRLLLECNIGFNNIETDEENRLPISAQNPDFHPTASLTKGRNSSITINLEANAQYRFTLPRWQFESLLGSSFFTQKNDHWIKNFEGYTNDIDLGKPEKAASSSKEGDITNYRFSSAFGRFKANFQNRYFFSTTGRLDASSRFGPKNRVGIFGSVGAGWIILNNYSFTKKDSLINLIKIRGSYGTSGNDQIGDYAYLTTYSAYRIPQAYQGIIAIDPDGLSNPQYKWEIVKKLELTLDLSLFKKKLNISVTGYRNRSSSLLITQPLPTQTGEGGIIENVPAIIQNTGIETEWNYHKAWKCLSWSGTFTVTIPRNKLIRFPDLENTSYKNLVIGQPLSTFKMFHYTGVDPVTGLFTTSGSGEPDVSGDLDPKWFLGFSNTIQWKNFQLQVFCEARKQKAPHYMVAVSNHLLPGQLNEGFTNNQPAELVNYWKNPGDRVPWQKFSAQINSPINNNYSNWLQTDAQLVDASFFRLKDISLTYALGEKFISKIHCKSVQVYINIENLLTVTSFKGADPEILHPYAVPPLKFYKLGVQITLNN